ncbi:MAG: AIR synthase-related protein, partial [Dehalococcoidia bacterium]
NANDVACMGAKPAWFLATILLPEGASPELASSLFDQILDACQATEIELVGGHTEISHRLERPIVVGAMLGEVEREQLVTGAGARPGDALILTKGIAIEGTALLAREATPDMLAQGLREETIEEAKGYIFAPGISVVKDALTACRAARVHAMHDPTEGGLATALHEMAEAAQVGIRVSQESVAVLAATEQICRAVGLDPLGLLASGALLIAVDPTDAQAVTAALAGADIEAVTIGRIVNSEEGVIIEGPVKEIPVPRFAHDEIARFLAQRGTSSNPDLSGRFIRNA